MKYCLIFVFVLSLVSLNGQDSNIYIELDSDDPLNILLTNLEDKDPFPPTNEKEWIVGNLVKQNFSSGNFAAGLINYKAEIGDRWSHLDGSFYALNCASKLDSIDWFWKVYHSCPEEIQARWQHKQWNPVIAETLKSKDFGETDSPPSSPQINHDLNEKLTLIFLEDQMQRNPSGKIILDEWVHIRLRQDSLTHLLDQTRNLPFLELSKIHWNEIDSILSTNPELKMEELGHFAKGGLEMALLHSRPSKVEKHYQFIRENFRADLVAYFVDKALAERALPQIFGSQGDTDDTTNKPSFYPILNLDKVDFFRMKVGLGPLREYAKDLGINYEEQVEMKQNLEKEGDK